MDRLSNTPPQQRTPEQPRHASTALQRLLLNRLRDQRPAPGTPGSPGAYIFNQLFADRVLNPPPAPAEAAAGTPGSPGAYIDATLFRRGAGIGEANYIEEIARRILMTPEAAAGQDAAGAAAPGTPPEAVDEASSSDPDTDDDGFRTPPPRSQKRSKKPTNRQLWTKTPTKLEVSPPRNVVDDGDFTAGGGGGGGGAAAGTREEMRPPTPTRRRGRQLWAPSPKNPIQFSGGKRKANS